MQRSKQWTELKANLLPCLWTPCGGNSDRSKRSLARDPDKLNFPPHLPFYEVFFCIYQWGNSSCVLDVREHPIICENISIFLAALTTAGTYLESYSLLGQSQDHYLYQILCCLWATKMNPPLGKLRSKTPPDWHITKVVAAKPKSYRHKISEVCMKIKKVYEEQWRNHFWGG